MSRLLPQSFFARDALIVARGLLGKLVRRGPVTLRISETEAYRWPHDSANHCRMGRTPRNEPMWGPAGHAYVYLCFGLHHMLNVVTGAPGEGEAVLIRACEPISGLAQITARRGGKRGPALLTGPGKVGQALAIDPSADRALWRTDTEFELMRIWQDAPELSAQYLFAVLHCGRGRPFGGPLDRFGPEASVGAA